jgi:ABC-type uncharacterized transport system substrate-binding protein
MPKRVELLHELVPTASVIALLVNPTDAAYAEQLQETCRRRLAALGWSFMS